MRKKNCSWKAWSHKIENEGSRVCFKYTIWIETSDKVVATLHCRTFCSVSLEAMTMISESPCEAENLESILYLPQSFYNLQHMTAYSWKTILFCFAACLVHLCFKCRLYINFSYLLVYLLILNLDFCSPQFTFLCSSYWFKNPKSA